MRRVRLTQDVIAIEKSPTEAAATATDNQLRESVDCPDCSDTMANPVILFSTSMTGEQESK